jgi:N utilization substance protein B
VQAIFLWEDLIKRKPEIIGSDVDKSYVLQYIWDNLHEKKPENADISDFDRERFFGMCDKLEVLQITIIEYAPEWPLEKIASHDRAILYLGTFELLHTDVPAPVIINEAVELAKEFGSERSSKFINGVLSSINKQKQSQKNTLSS